MFASVSKDPNLAPGSVLIFNANPSFMFSNGTKSVLNDEYDKCGSKAVIEHINIQGEYCYDGANESHNTHD